MDCWESPFPTMLEELHYHFYICTLFVVGRCTRQSIPLNAEECCYLFVYFLPTSTIGLKLSYFLLSRYDIDIIHDRIILFWECKKYFWSVFNFLRKILKVSINWYILIRQIFIDQTLCAMHCARHWRHK